LTTHTDRGRAERVVELDTGSFLVRPMRPEDSAAYSRFIARIDKADLHRRFTGSVGPDRDIALYTPIDYDHEMVFVAVQRSGADSGEIAGEVRAYYYPRTLSAEVGIIVRSDMKRRGLGAALLETMTGYAKENRIELIARIAPGNAAMLMLAARCGMQIEHRPGTRIAVAHLPGGATRCGRQ
jgi:acetyltransferase